MLIDDYYIFILISLAAIMIVKNINYFDTMQRGKSTHKTVNSMQGDS